MLSRDEMEVRRLAAARDFLDGATQALVAKKYAVSLMTASRWQYKARRHGLGAMKRRYATGRPGKLTAQQLSGLIMVLAEPHERRWTAAAVSDFIRQQFGFEYSQSHALRILRKYGKRSPAMRATP